MKNILFVLVVLNGLFFSNLFVAAEESEIDEDQLRLLDALPPDQKGRVLAKMQLASDLEVDGIDLDYEEFWYIKYIFN